MNVIMFGRASGCREMDSTALLATIPSPMAEPKATPATIIPKARSVKAATNDSEVKDVTFRKHELMLFADCERKIYDGQQRKDERLHRSDKEVKKLNEKRHDRNRQGEVERPDLDVLRDQQCDDDEE
jgi:hypothetical protein